MGIATAVDEFVTELKDAGLKRVWTSRKDVQPPGYLVVLNAIDYVLSAGVFDLTLVVFAIGPDVGEDETRALVKLDELHAEYIAAGFYPEGQTAVVGINIPAAAKPLPALKINATRST